MRCKVCIGIHIKFLILVHICFRRNPTLDSCDENSQILIEYHFYIFDDRKHDSKFVQHYFKLHWQYMVDNGHTPQWHWVWNNGCASQFKNSKPWYFVSKYPTHDWGL
jgi:hypothetical protein